jgi:cytochrome c oxidase cbb3-type subunit 4
MDINDIRSLVTVVSLVAFVGLVVSTWARHRRSAHDEAARLPFVGDETENVDAGERR